MKQFILNCGLVLLVFYGTILFLRLFWNFKHRTLRPTDRFLYQVFFWASWALFMINVFANVFSYPVVFETLAAKKNYFDPIGFPVIFFLVVPSTLLVGSVISARFQSFRSGSAKGSHGSIQTFNEHDSKMVGLVMRILTYYCLITFFGGVFAAVLSKSKDAQAVLMSLIFSGFMLVFGFWNLKSAYLILQGKDDASLGLLDTMGKKGGKK